MPNIMFPSRSLTRTLLISFVFTSIAIFCGLKYHVAAIAAFRRVSNPVSQATNTPPKITVAQLPDFSQGYRKFDIEIATVNDTETAAKDLVVSLVSAPAGITIENLKNNNGKVTVNIYVSCNRPFGALTANVKVADAGGLESTASLTINVSKPLTPPVLSDYPATVNVAAGANILIAPDSPPSGDNAISRVIFTSTASGFKGTLNPEPYNGKIQVFNAGPAGSYTVTVKAKNECGAISTKSFRLNVIESATCPTAPSLTATDYGLGHSQGFTFRGYFGDNMGIGDFNSDGKPDMAVIDETLEQMTTLLSNNVNGLSQSADSPIYFPGRASSITVSDFNGDAKMDLAVMHSSGIALLLGDGTGKFLQTANSPITVIGSNLMAGDFNNDGKADLVVVNNKINVLLGSGNGTFITAPNSPAYSGQASTADLNKDGKLDLVVVNDLSDKVVILLGNGNGTFIEAPNGTLTVGQYAEFSAFNDLRFK